MVIGTRGGSGGEIKTAWGKVDSTTKIQVGFKPRVVFISQGSDTSGALSGIVLVRPDDADSYSFDWEGILGGSGVTTVTFNGTGVSVDSNDGLPQVGAYWFAIA